MRKYSKHAIALAAILAGVSVFAAGADSLEGRWDATLAVKTTVIPFRLDISGSGANLKGTLYNGDDKEFTTSAKFENGKLVLDFAHYLTTITATLKDGQLIGKVDQRNGEVGGSAFQAKHYVAPPAISAARRGRAEARAPAGTSAVGASSPSRVRMGLGRSSRPVSVAS